MEFKSEFLLQAECDGKSVGYLYGLTVVTAGHPLGHCLDHAYGFLVESRMASADYMDVLYRTILGYDEFHDYATLNAFFG